MKIKRIVCLIAAAAMAFSLAACGGGNGGNSGGNEGGGADSGSAADAGEEMDFSGQTLTVANWSDYATDQEYGAAAFEELYNCNVEFYDITSYPELLQTMLSGGQSTIDGGNIIFYRGIVFITSLIDHPYITFCNANIMIFKYPWEFRLNVILKYFSLILKRL